MNNVQNYFNTSFKGNLIIKDKNGDRTLVPAKEVQYIEEKTSGLSKGVNIITNMDTAWGYNLKNIPYEKVVELYKQAMNSDDDVEIPNVNDKFIV